MKPRALYNRARGVVFKLLGDHILSQPSYGLSGSFGDAEAALWTFELELLKTEGQKPDLPFRSRLC